MDVNYSSWNINANKEPLFFWVCAAFGQKICWSLILSVNELYKKLIEPNPLPSSNITHVVIWDSRKMRMKTNIAGTTEANIIHTGKGLCSPIGLIIQPRILGLDTWRPLGTTSFCNTSKRSEVKTVTLQDWIWIGALKLLSIYKGSQCPSET